MKNTIKDMVKIVILGTGLVATYKYKAFLYALTEKILGGRYEVDETWIVYGISLLIACVTLPLLYRVISPLIKRRRYLNSDIKRIDKMSGEEFEQYLGAHFQKLGYKVNYTPKSNDFGADLIISKNGRKTAVQAKRYNEKVGNSAVQEIVASLKYYYAQDGMVITNSYFTQNAKILAQVNGIVLWDRNKLIKEFRVKGDNDL